MWCGEGLRFWIGRDVGLRKSSNKEYASMAEEFEKSKAICKLESVEYVENRNWDSKNEHLVKQKIDVYRDQIDSISFF